MSGWLIFSRVHGVRSALGCLIAHSLFPAMLSSFTVLAGWLAPSSSVDVPVSALASAICIVGFRGVISIPALGETVSSRPMKRYRWALLGALVLFGVATVIGVSAVADVPAQGGMAARNLVGALGATLLLRKFVGDAAWLLPAVFVSAELFFGGSPSGVPPSWAWTLQPAESSSALGVSIILATAGTLSLIPYLGLARTERE